MVPYIHTVSGITFVANGKPVSVASDHDKFQRLVDLLKQGAESEQLMAVLEEEKRAIEAAIRSADGKLSENLEILDGVLRYKDEPLHLYVGEKLVEMVRQGFAVTPVVNFIERLLKNPSKRAVDHLYAFLEHGKNPLTEDGKFIAYKAVRGDWKDIHSGTFDNSIGAEVEMPRWKVDDDPHRTCSSGLHACSFDYLPHFAHDNGHIVLVEIDPADVVAIPVDYNNTKMRVCKYKVIGEYEGYYKQQGNLLAGTALYASHAFAVEVRDNDDDGFEVVDSFDSLAEAAQFYEETEAYQVRLVNATSGKVLDERTDDDLFESSHNDELDFGGYEPDPLTFVVSAYHNLDDFQDDTNAIREDDFGDEEDALDRARELIEDYAIVRVTDSTGETVKTYGYTG